MHHNAGSAGGWRCAVKERARSRERLRKSRAADPEHHRVLRSRRIFCGRNYLAHAKSPEEAGKVRLEIEPRNDAASQSIITVTVQDETDSGD
jgi:beta-glucosidase-like glycosyl hydrolase